MTKGRLFQLANNKLKFDFGIAPNVDGLSEQKLIAHSVNVESLADGSGVRTRSGFRHYYPFTQVLSINSTELKNNIITGLKVPNIKSETAISTGFNIICSKSEDGSVRISDMKLYSGDTESLVFKGEEQGVSFVHTKQRDSNERPKILVGYIPYGRYIKFDRLYGNKAVNINYRIGLVEYEGQVKEVTIPCCAYTNYPEFPMDYEEKIIKGTLILKDDEGNIINELDHYSIVGSRVLGPNDITVIIMLDSPRHYGPEPEEGWSLPIDYTISSVNISNFPYYIYENPVKTTDIKTIIHYYEEWPTDPNTFEIIYDPLGQSKEINANELFPVIL